MVRGKAWNGEGVVVGGGCPPVAVPSLGPERESWGGGLSQAPSSCPGGVGEPLSAGSVGPGAVEGQRT